jgi:proton-dependent oligopeptide transporter, POT family
MYVRLTKPILLVILIPIFDKLIYPYLAKHGIKFGYIKRIALGIFIGGLSMIWAAICQQLIYADPKFNSELETKSGVSIYWQLPAYALIAMSEIFASIGSLEYSYTHAVP